MQTFTLTTGVEMPALGLGVFQATPGETRDAVRAALDASCRHIDTTAAYDNERQVGEAVHSSDVDRSEVFRDTKICIRYYGYDETLHGFDKSAGKVRVEQIDLLILHQALPSAFGRTLEAHRALEHRRVSRHLDRRVSLPNRVTVCFRALRMRDGQRLRRVRRPPLDQGCRRTNGP